ncbi:MAG: hypothetical protein RMX65_002065 [Nostoc sp. DedQUE01]
MPKFLVESGRVFIPPHSLIPVPSPIYRLVRLGVAGITKPEQIHASFVRAEVTSVMSAGGRLTTKATFIVSCLPYCL